MLTLFWKKFWLLNALLLLTKTFAVLQFSNNSNASAVHFILTSDIKSNNNHNNNSNAATKIIKIAINATNLNLNNNNHNNSNRNATKVPVRRDSINLEHMVFESATNNYNNQQNVKQMIKTMESHLLNIRQDELCVPDIQGIFDSLQFNGDISGGSRKNKSEAVRKRYARDAFLQDLQEFSERLERKLQKASHVVLNLRDFFRFNITQMMHQRLAQKQQHGSSNEKPTANLDEHEESSSTASNIDNDYDIDDVENLDEYTKLYLSTFIQPTFEHEDKVDLVGANYNKQQIQILNFLKTEQINEQLMNNFLTSNTELSLEMNAYIAEKMERMKQELLRTSEVYDLDEQLDKTPQDKDNVNIKFLASHFRHIYFLSPSDHITDKSEAYFYDMHFRQIYVSAIQKKFICLLIDVGSAMNSNLLEQTRVFVYNMLQLLSDTDLIQVITVANTANTMILETGETMLNSTTLYYATHAHKDEIFNYLSNINLSTYPTNHSLAFDYALKNLAILQKKSLISLQNPITFVYITRGLLTNLSDAMHVLNVIADRQRALLRPIRLHICAVVADEKSLMHEKQFLSDIATQNYTKYHIQVAWQQRLIAGKFFVLTKTQSDLLMQTAVAIFESSFTARYVSPTLEVHAPAIEGDSKDNIVSITQAIPPYGVVGVNLYLSDLIEDIVDYRLPASHSAPGITDIYAFLIDRSGRTLSHPAFPRPYARVHNYFPVDIAFLENSTNFNSIRQRMVDEIDAGNATTTVYLIKQLKTELMDRFYYWQSIMGIYIMCLVVTTERGVYKSTPEIMDIKSQLLAKRPLKHLNPYNNIYDVICKQQQNQEPNNGITFDWLYHRLDLLPNKGHLCRYFHQIATMDAATLFLSANAFESSFTFLHNVRLGSQHTQSSTVESIITYLKHPTCLLANPGLKPQIRHEVKVLYKAMELLRNRHEEIHARMTHNIIRRYIASTSGVLLIFPGCLLTNEYEPMQRPWFRQAMQHPGRIIITAPYLDAAGAGYIVTVAHIILEGLPNDMHMWERDRPVAVVALDIPASYYGKLFLDELPLCQQLHIKCLLFEHEGYLIAHPSMLKPSGGFQRNLQHAAAEHLTHKESYLANDILNHKNLVRKLACANFLNRTLQRNYRFNTTLNEILTNVVHNERINYALTLIPGSNVFAAVLNSSSETKFCPCSTIDRTCLNCKRMDQIDCECPCECPMLNFVDNELNISTLKNSMLTSSFINYTWEYAYCQPPSEQFLALPSVTNMADTYLPSCINTNCEIYGSQQKCLAIMGCEWCQQDIDGNIFVTPFCTAQTTCFNGILSSPTPYDDFDDVGMAVRGYIPGQKPNSYSAFGPVGGAIAVLGIVIGFAIYCYRYNMDTQSGEQFYVDSMHEENYGLPLSRFNFDDCQAHEDYGGGRGCDHARAQHNQLINAADISPYHMSSGSSYRRPPNGESDHGYSTMTPHEDSSEHQCFTLAEPLLLNDHINRHSRSDTMSISTSISSPTSRQQHTNIKSPPSSTKLSSVIPTATQRQQTNISVTSPARSICGQTQLPCSMEQTNIGPQYILAPVTVHRHMETTES